MLNQKKKKEKKIRKAFKESPFNNGRKIIKQDLNKSSEEYMITLSGVIPKIFTVIKREDGSVKKMMLLFL